MSPDATDPSDAPPPTIRRGVPREVLVRYVALFEQARGHDDSVDRIDAIVSILLAIDASGLSTNEVYRLARMRYGCLEDGSMTLRDLRTFYAYVQHLTLPTP